MGSLIFVIWLGLGAGDAASTQHAFNRGAHEIWLPDGASQGLAVGGGAAEGWGAKHLWDHGHKTAAVLLTIGGIVWKGWVIQHNISIEGGVR